MADLLEAIMIFCWGLSWPVSIHKSLTARTAKGKSFVFEVFVFVGYICGIVRKFLILSVSPEQNWLFYLAFVFYFINISCVTFDMGLWFRNNNLDKQAEREDD